MVMAADDPRRRLYIAQVKSDSGRGRYAVTIRNGQWECACRAWCTRMPRRDCKHIDRVKRAAMSSIRTGGINHGEGVDFQINWRKFATENLGARKTDAGIAVVMLLPLLVDEARDVAINAWTSICEIVNDTVGASP